MVSSVVFALHGLVHSMHGFCVAGNTTSITQLKIECEVHGAFSI